MHLKRMAEFPYRRLVGVFCFIAVVGLVVFFLWLFFLIEIRTYSVLTTSLGSKLSPDLHFHPPII